MQPTAAPLPNSFRSSGHSNPASQPLLPAASKGHITFLSTLQSNPSLQKLAKTTFESGNRTPKKTGYPTPSPGYRSCASQKGDLVVLRGSSHRSQSPTASSRWQQEAQEQRRNTDSSQAPKPKTLVIQNQVRISWLRVHGERSTDATGQRYPYAFLGIEAEVLFQRLHTHCVCTCRRCTTGAS